MDDDSDMHSDVRDGRHVGAAFAMGRHGEFLPPLRPHHSGLLSPPAPGMGDDPRTPSNVTIPGVHKHLLDRGLHLFNASTLRILYEYDVVDPQAYSRTPPVHQVTMSVTGACVTYGPQHDEAR